MSIGFLSVSISSKRVQNNGQPETESIAVDSVLGLPTLFDYSLVETSRFSDYTGQASYSCRYLHLYGLPRGICLSSLENSPANGSSSHFNWRAITGIYDQRTLHLRNAYSPVKAVALSEEYLSGPDSFMLSRHSFKVDGSIYIPAIGRALDLHLITLVNCVESFRDCWTIYASLKLPDLFLSPHKLALFDEALQRLLATSEPGFFPMQNIQNLDIRISVSIDKKTGDIREAVLDNGTGNLFELQVADLLLSY